MLITCATGGGNAITFRHGAFLFDSGAHRLHDKYPDVTRDLQALLGATNAAAFDVSAACLTRAR